MLPIINVGPLALPTVGLVYIIGAWIALSAVEWAAKRLNLDPENTYGLAATALIAGFVGARVVFVTLHWPAYRDSLSSIVWPLTSGYEAWGGLFFGLAAAFFYGRARKLPPAATFDALAPGLLTALILVSAADFLGGTGYGIESGLPWALDVFGIRRHPFQLYEIVAGLLALGVWWKVVARRSFDGQPFLAAAAIFCAGLLIFDAFRANPWITGDGYHVLQIMSLIILLASVFLLGRYSSEMSLQTEAGEPRS